MKFPDPYNGNGRGMTPIVGQPQVPMINFQIQVTQELNDAIIEYVQATGLDGTSFMNYVFTRGLTAIRQDLIYAQETRSYPSPDRNQGTTKEYPSGLDHPELGP